MMMMSSPWVLLPAVFFIAVVVASSPADVATLTLNTTSCVIEMGDAATLSTTDGNVTLSSSQDGSVVINTGLGLFTATASEPPLRVSTDNAGVAERAAIRASAAAAARRDIRLEVRGHSVSSSVQACNVAPGVIPSSSSSSSPPDDDDGGIWTGASAVPILVLTAPSRCHATTFVGGSIFTYSSSGGGWEDVTAAAATVAPALHTAVTAVGPSQTAGWVTWKTTAGGGDRYVLRLAYQPLEHLGTTCDLLLRRQNNSTADAPLSGWETAGSIPCYGITCGGATAVPGVGTLVVTGGYTVGSGIEATTSSLWLQAPGGGGLSAVATIQRALVVDTAFVAGVGLVLCVDAASGVGGGLWVYAWTTPEDPLTSGLIPASSALPGSGPCASVVAWTTDGDTHWMASSRTSAPPDDGTPDLFLWTSTDGVDWNLRQRVPFDATTSGGLRVDTLGPSPAVVTACGARAGTSPSPNAPPVISPGCGTLTWSPATRRLVSTDPLSGRETGTWWGVSATPWRDTDTDLPRLLVTSSSVPEALEEGGNATMYIVA